MAKVSIIISNRNDLAMLVVTVRSCIEELRPLGAGAGEIVIVDNSDSHIYQLLQRALPTGYIKSGLIKLIRQDFQCLFTARETAAREASGEYILCLDSHMVVGRDTIVDLLNFMDRLKDDSTLGFAHAPLCWAHQHESVAKHDREMESCELGNWGLRYDVERTMSWKGMPWICRREWFLNDLGAYGALSEHRISWGGGDMHIGIKPWLLGFKNWAVPTNPCYHIGPFPEVEKTRLKDRYRRYSTSGNYPSTFGFLVSCFVLGGEAMMRRNKTAIINRFGRFIDVNKWWLKAIELGTREREWLLKHQVMSFEQMLKSKPWEDRANFEQTEAIA